MTTKEMEIYHIGREIRNISAQKRALIQQYKEDLAVCDETDLEPLYPTQALKELDGKIRQLKRQRNWEQRKIALLGDPDIARPLSAVEMMNTWMWLILAVAASSSIFDIVVSVIYDRGEIMICIVASVFLHGLTLLLGLLMALLWPFIRDARSIAIEAYDNSHHAFEHGLIQGYWRLLQTYRGPWLKIMSWLLLYFPFAILAEKVMGIDDIRWYRASLLSEVALSAIGIFMIIVKVIIDTRRYRKGQVF